MGHAMGKWRVVYRTLTWTQALCNRRLELFLDAEVRLLVCFSAVALCQRLAFRRLNVWTYKIPLCAIGAVASSPQQSENYMSGRKSSRVQEKHTPKQTW